jgi:hypothetical protein
VPCSALQEEHLRDIGLKPIPKKHKLTREEIAWNKTATLILLALGILMIIGVITMLVLS